MSAVRTNGHYHLIDLPSGRSIRTSGPIKRNNNPAVEGLLGTLGSIAGGIVGSVIAPGAGTAIGAALGGGLGSAAEKGKKKKKGQPAATSAAPAEGGYSGSDPTLATVLHMAESQLSKDDIKSLLLSVPPPVLDQIRQAIKDEKGQDALAAIAVDTIASKTAPALNKIHQALAKAALSRQAVSEHSNRNKINKVIRTNTKNQNKLAKGTLHVLAKLNKLEKNINARRAYNRSVAAAFGVPLVYAG